MLLCNWPQGVDCACCCQQVLQHPFGLWCTQEASADYSLFPTNRAKPVSVGSSGKAIRAASLTHQLGVCRLALALRRGTSTSFSESQRTLIQTVALKLGSCDCSLSNAWPSATLGALYCILLFCKVCWAVDLRRTRRARRAVRAIG